MDINDIIGSMTSKADEADTYTGDDGLLYCSLCNTKRQSKVKGWTGEEMIVPCLCKCQTRAREERKIQEEEEQRRLRIMANKDAGFNDDTLKKSTFESDDGSMADITKKAKNYVKHFKEFKAEGRGLMFFGTVGTGKSFMAACIANALMDEGYMVLMTSVSRIVNQLGESFEGRQDRLDNLNNYDLLILDDLSSERKTEYMQEQVFNIIDARYRSGKPMIVTTNLTKEQITSPSGIMESRIMDRIIERCYPIEVNGVSHRKRKQVEYYAETKRLLEE